MVPPREDPYTGVLAISLLAMIFGLVLLILGMLDAGVGTPPTLPPDHPVRVG